MKRLCVTLMVIVVLLSVGLPVTVCAAETDNTQTVTIRGLEIDESKASFTFTVNVEADDSYAGAEFGAFCSKGVQITSVESSGGTVVGPIQANGLVWFSFFDGENSFEGTQSMTVYGSYEVGQESAIKISDINIYSIQADEYITTSVKDNVEVQISTGTESLSEVVEDSDINIMLLVALLLVVVAIAIIIFVYIKITLKRKKGETDKNV